MSHDEQDVDFMAIALGLAAEFEAQVRRVFRNDPAMARFLVKGVTFAPDRALVFLHTDVPPGRQAAPADWEHARFPDRVVMVDLIRRMYRHRTLRISIATGVIAPVPAGWRDVLQRHFPNLLDCSIGVGDGWADLWFALCGTLDDLGADIQFQQIKEKYGTLRAHRDGTGAAATREVIECAELLSSVICEECGAPGRLGKTKTGWWSTRCQLHRTGVEAP